MVRLSAKEQSTIDVGMRLLPDSYRRVWATWSSGLFIDNNDLTPPLPIQVAEVALLATDTLAKNVRVAMEAPLSDDEEDDLFNDLMYLENIHNEIVREIRRAV
jgi:hypothetical protein